MKRSNPSILALSLLAASLLAGCASAPQIVASGPLDALRGKSVQMLTADPAAADALTARTNAAVLAGLAQHGAVPAKGGKADYQVQAAFSALPAGVAVSRAGRETPIESGWSSPPFKRRLFDRGPGPGYALTVVALDGATGKVALSATATDRNPEAPDKALTRLTDALFAPVPPAR